MSTIPAPRRRVRVALRTPLDLDEVSTLISGDSVGESVFGGFYSHARDNLTPLIGESRRVWIITVDGVDAGFVDAERIDDTAHVAVFVAESQRRLGVASAALGQFLGLCPWRDVDGVRMSIAPENLAGRGLAERAGYRLSGTTGLGDQMWERLPARPSRPRSGPERFLRADGSVDRYPAQHGERRALLALIADRAFLLGAVYSESEVNDALRPFSPDVATLRRYLIDHALLERTRSGTEYARIA